jgi:hypothetical protein
MNDAAPDGHAFRNRWMRTLLLVLALLTSPALCCGGLQVLDSIPESSLPASLDFAVNLFEKRARVENQTSETLYITAITTTYGDPRIIPQNIAFRQRSIRVRAQQSMMLEYDSADLPLAGIVVCRTPDDCRMLPANHSDIYELTSYEALEGLEPDWLEATQAVPLYNYGTLLIAAFSLVSILLFGGWIYLIRRGRHTATASF